MYAKDKTSLVDRREMLRVKIKSLVAEAHIIRAEERKTHGDLRNQLRDHRVRVVRWHSRHVALAMGFIRGRRLDQMEPNAKSKPDFKEIEKMLKKYGPAGVLDRQTWLDSKE